MPLAKEKDVNILPIDSEHNAIYQCMMGHRWDDVENVTLTASGGPFLSMTRKEMYHIAPAEALRHPTWNMGAKISIDSATMMNKGLEVIEAYWLFDLPPDQIEVLIHPQQAVHGMVYFRDGSVVTQLAGPDMRTPISYALAWPDRLHWTSEHFDLAAMEQLTFAPVDTRRFPSFGLARQALSDGGAAPAVLNAANEVAVSAFLEKRIGFMDIPAIVETVLSQSATVTVDHLDAVMAIDADARRLAAKAVTKNRSYLSP